MWHPYYLKSQSESYMAEIKTQTLDSYLRLIEISRDLASTLDLDTLLKETRKPNDTQSFGPRV